MAPEERRAAIIRATLPLLIQHGPAVSTRQISAAAGVAEGTIFRAFPDKPSLIAATVAAAIDPAPLVEELAHIDPALPLAERLIAVVRALQERHRRVVRLMSVLSQRLPQPPERRREQVQHIDAAIQEAIGAVLVPDRDNLRIELRRASRLVWMLSFASAHPLTTDKPPDAAEIVDLALHGMYRPTSPSGDPT